ncbi:MAG: bifunctional phosphopantothenoylcysteine decarboxylase/phosphopantothenate--cysteine ligase CoaBC, partial [Muribaculaceae bacterium]|nr:bifunctional phosphopantothenoylcysteine decarboxylase/phosphopantothenate--cysteine ligase CoaBC [Muribaculaceae bacterium]
HPTTTNNIKLLQSYGNIIIEPTSGELASHLVGKGRMAEPAVIVDVLDKYFSASEDLKGKKVLITAGPTIELIDPVRYISNFSTGKQGFALAEECAKRGADVVLVSGPVSLCCNSPRIKRIDVESADEMCDAAVHEFDGADIAIMCAAVADYKVDNISDKKIKREEGDVPSIRLVKNRDIAKTLGEMKRNGQILAGFALETDNEIEHAVAKLKRKNLDFIVLNSLRDKDAGFKVDTNHVEIISSKGTRNSYETKSKSLVARDIVNYIVENCLK